MSWLSLSLCILIIDAPTAHSFVLMPTTSFRKRCNSKQHDEGSLFASHKYFDPPASIANLTIGQPHKKARQRDNSNDHGYTIERISNDPPAFLLRNFLSPNECSDITSQAEWKGMAAAETRSEEGKSARQACDVAWLPSFSSNNNHDDKDSFHLGSILEQEIRSLLIQNETDSMTSHSLFAEYLQVLKYQKGGMYEIHHDGRPRFLTVIYYLNGIGATWFPFATLDHYDPCHLLKASSQQLRYQFHHVRNGVEGVSMNIDSDELHPGIHGVVVASRASLDEEDVFMANGRIVPMDQGDVLAFYNFQCGSGKNDADDDGTIEPRENWRALHAGLPAEEEKMIANHWFRFVENDGVG